MQDHLRFLSVDDVSEWADHLKEAVTEYFVEERRFARARVRGQTAYTASQADGMIADGGWDLVLLDMNLGHGSERRGVRERISGLDLLADIARGNRAFFVIIVTGAVTDPTLEKIYGKDTAELLRLGAMNEAVKMMPASRIRILHKPEAKMVSKAVETLKPHLHSALDQYCSVSLERNVFRALPGDPDLLEICFNGGPRLTLPFEAPFRTIQSALAQPNRMLKVTELIQRLAQSSGRGGPVTLPDGPTTAPKARRALGESTEHRGVQDDEASAPAEFDQEAMQSGLGWEDLERLGVGGGLYEPAETTDGTIPIETLIGGLLAASRRRLDLQQAVDGILKMGVDEAVLLAIPRIAAEWGRRGSVADAQFSVEGAPDALAALVKNLRPILEPIRLRWLHKRQTGVRSGSNSGGKKVRVALAADSKEMELARQHWSRFKKKIKARPALKDFHTHMEAWISRDPTSRGHLYYRPPGGGELCPFWLTE